MFNGCDRSINIMGIISCFLLRLKAHLTGRNPCLILEIWSRTHNWSPRAEPITVILLNGNSIKLPSKYLSLYSYCTVALRFHHRHFCAVGGVNTETHNRSKCRKWVTMEWATTNRTSVSHAHPKAQGLPPKRCRKTVRARGQGESEQHSIFWTWRDCSTHELRSSGCLYKVCKRSSHLIFCHGVRRGSLPPTHKWGTRQLIASGGGRVSSLGYGSC